MVVFTMQLMAATYLVVNAALPWRIANMDDKEVFRGVKVSRDKNTTKLSFNASQADNILNPNLVKKLKSGEPISFGSGDSSCLIEYTGDRVTKT